jgi:hypothetical protein
MPKLVREFVVQDADEFASLMAEIPESAAAPKALNSSMQS